MNFKTSSKCAVLGCNNYYKRNKDTTKSFFRMTRDANSLKSWILACHRKDLLDLLDVKETDYFYYRHVICSDHFDTRCFINKNMFSMGLRFGSVPTLNLYRVPKKPERKVIDVNDNKRVRKSLDKFDSNLGKSYADEITLEEINLKPLEAILFKPSEDPCIFCGSMGNLRNLHRNNTEDNKMENYLQMISSCFSIKLVDHSGCAGLCETCVSRLRDATLFRAQVEAAEALLQQTKEKPTNPQNPEQQPTVEDNSSIYEAGEDVDTTFTYADCDTPLESGSREVLKITWSEDEEAGRRQGRVEWIDQIIKYQKVKSVEPKLLQGSNKCTVCDKVFGHKLKKHFEIHLPKTLCEFCGKQFNFLQTYRLHLGTHLKEHRVTCPQCNTSLASKTGLLAHIKTRHQGKKLFICPKGCRDRFGNLYQRNEHLMKKHGVWYNRYECPECSRACFTPWRLDLHVRRMHRQERNIECPECDRVFVDKWNMRKHLQTHSKEKNFICDLCGKAFKSRVSIRKHLQIHYNIRENPCPFCDVAFVQTSSLKYHVRTHHKDVASISKKTRMKEDTNEPEIVYTIIYHEDEGAKVEDVIM